MEQKTQIRLIVHSTLIPNVHFRWPAGYSEVWSRPTSDELCELIIEGPFPPEVEDGDELIVMTTLHSSGDIDWQWQRPDGTPVSDQLRLEPQG